MQVIAGSARRILLKTLPGDHTRPTSSRIKETLFNILQPYVPGSSFLDLFAGSGGIAIEALSRGAKKAVLVDNSRLACAVIRENLERTRLAAAATLLQTEAGAAIRRLAAKGESFDIVFMDPPYQSGAENQLLPLLAASPIIHEDTLIVLEMPLDRELPEVEAWHLKIVREKEYKNNKHVFMRLEEET